MHEGVPHDFVMNDYRAEHLYAIDGKRKGSGISIYYHNKVSFSRLRSIDFRNNYFECILKLTHPSFHIATRKVSINQKPSIRTCRAGLITSL